MYIRQNYRIYPNKKQMSILDQWIGSTRFVWNHMLGMNIDTYNETGKFVFEYDMNKMLPQLKKEYPWLKDVPSQGLQQKCQDLSTALSKSFKSNENRKGFPKFKSKKRSESGIRFADFKIRNNRIFLPKQFKKNGIKIVIDREFLGKPGLITIKRNTANIYWVSIIMEIDVSNCLLPSDAEQLVGIDVGIKSFLVTSDGEVIENPHYLKKNLKKLKTLQRKHSKKIKGSNNREKSRLKIAKLHYKISNQRDNFIKQTTAMIAKLYDFVSVEDLNISGMVQNHNLAQALNDASLSKFLIQLEWQCKKRGKFFHKINRFFASSKTCHKCGYVNKDLTLSDRTYICPVCGLHMDRDANAAINILKEGCLDCNINIPKELGKFTPVSYDSTLVLSEQETADIYHPQ